MSDDLFHDPEGDRNPYVPVPWGRSPLVPVAGETVAVGVTAEDSYSSVVVEWANSGESGSVKLSVSGDHWTGDIGPFDESCSYRFVGNRAASPDVVTDWFSLPVAQWHAGHLAPDPKSRSVVSVDSGAAIFAAESAGPRSVKWSLRGAPRGDHHGDDTELSITPDGLAIGAGHDLPRTRVERCILDGETVAWRVSWRIAADEQFFGTGERFDQLGQRGNRRDVRVYEQYKQQGERTYFPVPWIWSTSGYGLFIDGAERVQFDLGASAADEASVTIPGAEVSGRWYFGSPQAMLTEYVADVGLPLAVPNWAFGPWMSGNEWNSEARVREVVKRTIDEAIPATVLVIEAWSDETTFYMFNGAKYAAVEGDRAVAVSDMQFAEPWPDPIGLVEWLHSVGVRVLLWQIPLLKDVGGHDQHHADIAFAEQDGLCVLGAQSSYRNRGWWFPGARAIDFTNPAAREWWFAKRSYLLDSIGVDGFKTDGGEHLWGADVTTHAGEEGHAAGNAYPTHYLSAYHQFMKDHGRSERLTFSRAGHTGAQAFPAHWAGDEDSTWEAFRASITAGLTAAASGVAFWSWDLAGFSGQLPTAELYMRSCSAASFAPIMQYHSEHNEHREPLADRTPWNVAAQTATPEVIDVYRFYARLRMNLVPYLVTLGQEAALTGIPLMRPLVLEFPDDTAAVAVSDQFLLGPDLLIAPILEEGASVRRVYIPRGEWRCLWSGIKVESGETTATASVDQIPVYVRAGGVVPLWMPSDVVELGAPVGLPEPGSGRLVLMTVATSGSRRLVDPVSKEGFEVEMKRQGDALVVQTIGLPSGTSLWIRDGEHSTLVPLQPGDQTKSIDLTAGLG